MLTPKEIEKRKQADYDRAKKIIDHWSKCDRADCCGRWC